MSHNKMLIDATHPEETRVVVLRGGRVEEFDYESAARKLLRGNIYLAKVTRVEPSLQAAFVDYGGNRHGFLAFNEIHPDYYQIPMADRQALIDEEARAEAEEEAEADARAEAIARRRRRGGPAASASTGRLDSDDDREAGRDDDQDRDPESDGGGDEDPSAGPHGDTESADRAPQDDDDRGDPAGARHESTFAEASGLREDRLSEPPPPETVGGFEPAAPHPHDADHDHPHDHGHGHDHAPSDSQHALNADGPSARDPSDTSTDAADERPERDATGGGDGDTGGGVQEVSGGAESAEVDQVGSEDALEEFTARPRPRRRTRSYKIQEVIKRRQVILVQVVKEERGTKGAALTTYLSLAGRYTVLMPNTARGGGISRKISSPQDRKRLKAIAQDLEVPEGMGLIIRTAGAARTQQEIKRDFEYLLRLWESVRELTLQSEAPSLVYEEGNLIKRSIRDLYNKDVDEIVVAGAEAHRDAHDFMRMLMPSHAKNVIEYKAPEPLFTKYGIERQLNAMFSPYVTLRSGGYLVINQTEALVAVDVNSGKSTREFSIEETALNTNLEASDEIARQVKLRDLAGLIVIDFIDMDEKRNNRAVERRLKDALRFDRARIQLGRISHFGLMEMSRQRLRTGVLEGSTTQCPHCQGTGIIRSIESVALAVLRGLEDAVTAGARTPLIATTTPTVALYILNNKRAFIIDMETRLGLPVTVQGSDKLQGANYTIEKGATPLTTPLRRTDRNAVNMDWGFDGEETDADAPADTLADGPEFVEPRQGARAERERPRREARVDDGGRDRETSGRDDGERDGPAGEDGGRRRRRRRRRGGRGGDRFEGQAPRLDANGNRTLNPQAGSDADDEEGDDASDGARITFAPDDDAAEMRVTEINATDDDADDDGPSAGPRDARSSEEGEPRRRGRRRGRRGGRRNRERGEGPAVTGFEPQPFVGSGQGADGADGEPESDVVNAGMDTGDGDGMPPRRTRADADDVTVTPASPPARDPARHSGRNGGEHHRDRPALEARPERPEPQDRPERVDRTERAANEAGPAKAPASDDRAPSAAPTVTQAIVPDQPADEGELPRHRQRALVGSSEPKIERVVLSPDQSGTPSTPAETERPARKGWWSRRFGSE